MVKPDLFFKTALFGHVSKKSTHALSCAWSFLLVIIQFTLSMGPEAL